MKKALIVVVALLVLVVGALFIVPPLLSWDFVKTRVAAAVKQESGHDLEIGTIELSLLPSISAKISDLSMTSPAAAPSAQFLTIGSVDLGLALWPLIGKSVVVDRFVVQDLTLDLEVGESGQANWQGKSAGGKPSETSEPSDGGFPLSNLVLGDVRLENGQISYRDKVTGQAVTISAAALQASLPGLAGRLALKGAMVVNEQQVTLDLTLESPEALLQGQAASLKSNLSSPLVALASDLRLQSKPQPAVDGTASLEIASVGELLAWLERPLPAEQPDPGAVKLAASFKTEGAKVILEEAAVTGEALDAKASGSLDAGGETTKVSLLVESGLLDIDRYLPPPADKTAAQPQRREKMHRPAEHGSPIEALSDDPFDLAGLKNTEADIRVVIGGIKAVGYEVGPIDFTALLKAGKLEAELVRLSLYGGNVTGKARLDASGEAPAVTADVALAGVDLGKLSAVGADGPPPVAGIASGSLKAEGSGVSPRALVQDLKGGLDFKLGKIDVKNAPAAALSGVDVAVELPGLAKPPSLKGSLVYNKEKVGLDLSLDPLDKVLSGATFALNAALSSDRVNFSYKGSVQQQPLPGLNGRFAFDVPSVGKLAAWLGQPLPDGQPDPGPLKITAVLQADGGKAALTNAVIEGDDLSVRASGQVEVGDDATKVALDVTGGFIDIDRYLPPPAEKAKKKGSAKAKPAAGQDGVVNILAAIPDTPIDLTAFKALDADIKIALEGIKSGGVEVAPVSAVATAGDGVLTLDLTELGLYGGTVTSHVSVKDVKDSLNAELALNVGGLALGELLQAAGNETPPASGTAALAVTAKAAGKSPRKLVESLVANISASLDKATLAALPDGRIDQLRFSFDVPALAEAAKGQLSLLLNDEKATLDLDLDSPKQALSGEAFALRAGLSSNPVSAKVDGTVQQAPLPGLSGSLSADIGSVAGLAAWLGQPLPEGQPDPGPLNFAAQLMTEGEKLTVESMTLDGKAVKASGKGSFDGSGEITRFSGLLDIASLDLNAYLPPDSGQGAKKAPADGATAGGAKKKKAGAAGWSEKPFKLGALRRAEGNFKVKTGQVLYRTVSVKESSTTVALKAGVLTATIAKLNLDQGRASGNAVVDASKKAAALSYELSLKGIESKPFLESFAEIDWLSGRLVFDTKGSAKGRNEKEVVESLNGDGAFKFKDGAIEGFDLAGTLRNAQALGISSVEGSDRPKTEFTELGGSYTITNGLFNNPDLKMLAPLVRVNGAGVADLPPRTLDYRVEATLVSSLEGQGGDDTLAGLPIPVHAHGPWDNLAFDIDWKTVLGTAVLDPGRLENLPDGLNEAAKGLGVLIPGAGSGDDTAATSGGESSLEGAVGGALNSLFGGSDDEATSEEQPKKKKRKKKKAE